MNKGHCDRIFGLKILEGLRAPAPAVMPGMLRLSTEALAESPRRAPWNPSPRLLLDSPGSSRPRAPRRCLPCRQRAGLEREVDASAARPPSPAFAVEVARPASLRDEGRRKDARRGMGAPASARSRWSPPRLAESPRRTRQCQIYKINRGHCDRTFGQEILSRSSCSSPRSSSLEA